MSNKHELRLQRNGTIINNTSKKEDRIVNQAVRSVIQRLSKKFGVEFIHEKRLLLTDVVDLLKERFPKIEFSSPLPTSFMMPDGGITYIQALNGNRFPILIGEVKNQGTNDIRKNEGKPKQSKGNAIERLGKNVIGFRTYMLGEGIFPFVCFGDGCDFEDGSSILDRVLTIAMFGKLNCDHTVTEARYFNRGSYYFRRERWTKEEMEDILYDVAERSVYHYFSKYGEKRFVCRK